MATIVLVHGAWHGAWCWSKLIPKLENLGHKAIAFDLPGGGDDKTPSAEITLDSYANKICKELESLDDKVFLLGHSMGGMAISAAAEKCPDKIHGLIYLTAFLPRNHESLFMIEERNPKPRIPPSLILSDDEKSATIAEDKLKGIFYHDCSDDDIRFAITKLTPQALEPMSNPITLSKKNFGSLLRAYIECIDDRAICIELQRGMIEKLPCAVVCSLPASHSPFLSVPGDLAEMLDDIVEKQSATKI